MRVIYTTFYNCTVLLNLFHLHCTFYALSYIHFTTTFMSHLPFLSTLIFHWLPKHLPITSPSTIESHPHLPVYTVSHLHCRSTSHLHCHFYTCPIHCPFLHLSHNSTSVLSILVSHFYSSFYTKAVFIHVSMQYPGMTYCAQTHWDQCSLISNN